MDELIDRLQRARHVAVLTGAGISAASGIPTFRGAGGLWKQHRPEQLATPEAFARDAHTVWEWYDWRRQVIAKAEPNDGHRVLAAWQSRFPAFTLITQNVDGLHERAGSTGVIRYHGSIWRMRCTRALKGRATGCDTEWEDLRAPLPELPQRCPACGALARPGVVWFGEPIPPQAMRDAARAAASCDVFLTIGTSSVVYPAAALVNEAARGGAYTVEINPEITEASAAVHLTVHAGAETALPEIAARLRTAAS